MTRSITRGPVLSFFDLPEWAQGSIMEIYGGLVSPEYIQEASYFKSEDDIIPSFDCLIHDGPIWDSIVPSSAFSATHIKLSRDGTEALCVERYF